MGGGSWKADTYTSHVKSKGLINSNTTKGMSDDDIYKGILKGDPNITYKKSAKELYKETKLNQSLDPKNVKVRESRDSAEHPQSNAIALILDVTGSMNIVAKHIAEQALPKLMTEIYNRKPVTDPQILFMGVDDLEADGHLQVSQFESDIRVAQQLDLLWLENRGGGNDYESYSLPWFFLANHTSIDCFEKRGKKGYAISCGDECVNPSLSLRAMQNVLGYKPQSKHSDRLDTADILKKVQEKYHVLHVIAEEGSFARSNKSLVKNSWEEALGAENVIMMPDFTKLAEIVISAMQISEGADPDDVAKSWEDKKTMAVVSAAVKNVKRIISL